MPVATRAFLGHTVVPRSDVSADINVVAGASVYVCDFETTDLIPQALYAGPAGVTEKSNPLTADANGFVSAYLEHTEVKRVTLRVGAQDSTTAYPSQFTPDPFAQTLKSGPYPTIDVTMFGATGDGVADDTAAIQAAVDAAPDSGAVIYFPGGPDVRYLVDSASGSFEHHYAASGSPDLTVTLEYGVEVRSRLTFRSDGARLVRGPSVQSHHVLLSTIAPVEDVTFQDMIFDQDVLTLADNTAQGSFVYLVYLEAGSRRLTLERCRFVNLGTRVNFKVSTDSSVVYEQVDGLKLLSCTFERSLPGPVQDTTVPEGNPARNLPENQSVAWIMNASHVLLDHCRWFSTLTGPTAGIGGLGVYAISPLACGGSSPMTDLVVQHCSWEEVQDTALFITGNAGTVQKDVTLDQNVYTAGGKWIEKGWLALAIGGGNLYGATVTNNLIRDWGHEGSSTGNAQANAAQGMLVGGTNVIGCLIEGNQLDGAPLEGALSDRRRIGIQVGGPAAGVMITRNVIKNLGYFGIGLSGTASAPFSDWTIDGNIVSSCCYGYNTGQAGAGIEVWDHISGGTISDNRVYNCGNGGVLHAGIGLGSQLATASQNTISGVRITGNHAYDTRSPKLQSNGIRIGTGTTASEQPSSIYCHDNNATGNLSLGVHHHRESNRGQFVERNSGDGGIGDLVLLGAVATTAQFYVPCAGSDAPLAALVLAEMANGDDYAVALYLLARVTASSATQHVTLISTRALNGGVAPTVAPGGSGGDAAAGRFVLTNPYGGAAVCRVYVTSLRRGNLL